LRLADLAVPECHFIDSSAKLSQSLQKVWPLSQVFIFKYQGLTEIFLVSSGGGTAGRARRKRASATETGRKAPVRGFFAAG
jgi:hypothetical protein